eukprot:SAG11_NODE_33013_length_279_cov_1.155556_1_plen_50_part_10
MPSTDGLVPRRPLCRNYEELERELEPLQLMELLAAYLGEIEAAIAKHQGT